MKTINRLALPVLGTSLAGTDYDTGATLASLLGIRPPQCWIGHPSDEAFREAH